MPRPRTGALILVALVVVAAATALSGCSNEDDFLNPYDAANPLGAGSPPGLTVAPGNKAATVSWLALGVQGIDAYRIYRRFDGDSDPTFQRVPIADGAPAEIPAVIDPQTGHETPGHRYEFIDTNGGTGLLNDQATPDGKAVPYVYRVTVVDDHGVETPDPNAPHEITASGGSYWPTVNVTPSEPAPPPDVRLAADDLRIIVSWETYEVPGDASSYRVYGAFVDDGIAGPLRLLDEITIETPLVGEVIDGPGGAPKRYTDKDFTRDGQIREYLVTVMDQCGVESDDRPDLRRRARTPNLPPGPVRIQGAIPVSAESVELHWSQAPERDLQGYNIYARDVTNPTGWRLARTVRTKTATSAEVSATLLFSEVFVTAFDDTPRDDGGFDQIYPPGYVHGG